MSNLFELIKRLVKSDVDFVIVGGFAGVVYGCTYVTQDVDLCCAFSIANLLRLQKVISDLQPVHRMTPKRPKLELTEENCNKYKNLYLDTDIGRLYCLSFIDGVGDYEKAKQNSNLMEIDDIRFRVLNLDALIETKKAMNRPRDKEAVLQLEAIKKMKK